MSSAWRPVPGAVHALDRPRHPGGRLPPNARSARPGDKRNEGVAHRHFGQPGEVLVYLPRHRCRKALRHEEAVSPFEALRREIDRLFEDFRPAGWRMALRRHSAFELGWPRLEGWQLNPAMDMVEKDAAFEITAELPGIDEKNVEIRLANGNLTIRGEKQEVKEEREKEYHLSERCYGAFQRMFRVPDGVHVDRIEAKVEKGVLTVNLPEAPGAKSSERRSVSHPPERALRRSAPVDPVAALPWRRGWFSPCPPEAPR